MKKIIIVMALVFSSFLFLGCPIGCGGYENHLLSYKINKETFSINENAELSIIFGKRYCEDEPLVAYINGLSPENIKVLFGKKFDYESENDIFYIKMDNYNDYNYKSTLSFSFEKSGKYKISFSVFFIDENGNVKEKYPVEKKITITVTE